MTRPADDVPDTFYVPASPAAMVLLTTARKAGEQWAEYEYVHAQRPGTVPTHKDMLASLIVAAGQPSTYIRELHERDVPFLSTAFLKGAAGWLATQYLEEAPDAEASEIAEQLEKKAYGGGALGRANAWLRAIFGLSSDTPGEDVDPDGYFVPLATYFLLAFLLVAYESEREARKEAERRVAEVRRTPLRKGTGAMRAMLKTDVHVTAARRRNQHAGRELTPQQVEARKLFRYEPLGWAERLVVFGLATLAREQGLLDSHPWATRPMLGKAGESPTRIKMAYPGTSEIGRIAGFKLDAKGKVPRETRRTIERALRSLCTVPRWIAMPVLVPSRSANGKPIEDIEVVQTLWIEASETLLEAGSYLSLHPAAIATHMRSYSEMLNAAAQYETARKMIGKPQMLDEWAIADDYLRSLALAQPGVGRRAQAGGGDGPQDVQAILEKKLAHKTLLHQFALEGHQKKHGAAKAMERVRDALLFCTWTGALLGFAPTDGGWIVQMPHPDLRHVDDEQLLLLGDDKEEQP